MQRQIFNNETKIIFIMTQIKNQYLKMQNAEIVITLSIRPNAKTNKKVFIS